MLTQDKIQAIFIPLLKKQGRQCAKKQNIWARVAAEGELIMTITSDGLETSNIATEGDMIVKNQTDAKEMYVMKVASFEQRYASSDEALSDSEGFQEYIPIGKIWVLLIDYTLLDMLNLSEEFYFEAPWGSSMVCKKDDYLVTPPDFSQVYRIARKEFFETYKFI
jgi:hypothetical protein